MEVLKSFPPETLLNLVDHPKKSESSRKTLESTKVVFTDGIEYELNKSFIDDAIRVSDTLNLDEKIAAEVLYHVLNNDMVIGVDPVDAAIIAWYDRGTFILQILSYYLNNNNGTSSSNNSSREYVINLIKNKKSKYLEEILASLKLIGEELENIKKSVDSLKLLGEYNVDSVQMKNITYRRDTLYKQHQLLGEILHGYFVEFLVDVNADQFKSVLNHIQTFDTSDIFVLSYLPALMFYVTSIEKINESIVDQLHKNFMMDINNLETLADFPLKALIILAFLTSFITWCKSSANRASKYDFNVCVEFPMTKLISIGALEQFLAISADTSIIELRGKEKPYYDFRGFFQRHIPKYVASRCLDIDEHASNKMKPDMLALTNKSSSQTEEAKPLYATTAKDINPDPHFVEFIVTSLHNFVFIFVSNAAFMLTSLRDEEEDLLLSEDDDIEVISENADLERAYLGMFYLYSYRPALCYNFWINSELNYSNNPLYGFLQWASRCNSPLIMSSYSLLLSALASDKYNAEKVFTFLQSTNSESNGISSQDVTIRGVRNSNSLLMKYGSVSWSTIYSSLSYFNTQLKKAMGSHAEESNFGVASKSSDAAVKHNVIAELGEDSVIYLSSLFHIIISVSKESPEARRELLESDDGQLIGLLQGLLIGVEENVIKGAILNVFSHLVGSDSLPEINPNTNEKTYNFEREIRNKIWNVIDSWIFNSATINLPMDRLSNELSSFPLISGFAHLLSSLLSPYPDSNNIVMPFEHNFPLIKGSSICSSSVSIYLEFLITEVFPSIQYSGIDSVVSKDEKNRLQLTVLRLISKILNSLDPDFVESCQAAGLKEIDHIVSYKSGGVVSYLQSHPGSIAMKSMYVNSVYDAIFKISNVGIDNLNQFSSHSIELELVLESLSVLDLALQRDSFYVNDLVPILRLKDNQFMDPSSIGSGTGGLRNFFDAFVINLDFVTNLSLYVSASDRNIAKTSLRIFTSICASKTFNSAIVNGLFGTSGSGKEKMLILLETVDESARIKESWIQQFEAPIDAAYENQDIGIKIAMLEFLLQNLLQFSEPSNPSSSNVIPTISHFLLGFDTRRFNLGSEIEMGFINSDRSLLKAIVYALRDVVLMLNSSNIEHDHARFAYLSMEILLTLSKSRSLCHAILTWLRNVDDNNLTLHILKNSKSVNTLTYWSGKQFDETVSIDNQFSSAGDSMPTLTFFIKFRASFFELLTKEIEDALNYNVNVIYKYVTLLSHSIGYGSDSNKLLEFLDIASFQNKLMLEKVEDIFSVFDFKYMFGKIKMNAFPVLENGTHYDLSIIDKLVTLFAKEQAWNSRANETEIEILLLKKIEQLKKIVICSLNYDSFKWSYYEYLKSWCSLVQYVTEEGFLGASEYKKSNFILEVFQSVLPRIDEYLENNVIYAEVLVSLCVHLLQGYVSEKNRGLVGGDELETKSAIDARRLFSIFKICVRGILSPSGSSKLRSDLYTLAKNYLDETMISKEIVLNTDLLIFIRSIDTKFFEIIFHDSLVGEGYTKVSSLLLLESILKCLTKLNSAASVENNDGSQICEKFILDIFCSGNYLPALVQSLKTTDEAFIRVSRPLAPDNKLTIKEFIFQITSYKATMSLLIRLAQSKIGAQQLLQSDIFKTIRDCQILNVDADFGWELNLEGFHNFENGNQGPIKIRLSLDNPAELIDGTSGSLSKDDNPFSSDMFSMYEMLIPAFQLITTILITLGPQNEKSLKEASVTENHFSRLIKSVFKREILIEEQTSGENPNTVDLKEVNHLTNLFTLLNALI